MGWPERGETVGLEAEHHVVFFGHVEIALRIIALRIMSSLKLLGLLGGTVKKPSDVERVGKETVCTVR